MCLAPADAVEPRSPLAVVIRPLCLASPRSSGRPSALARRSALASSGRYPCPAPPPRQHREDLGTLLLGVGGRLAKHERPKPLEVELLLLHDKQQPNSQIPHHLAPAGVDIVRIKGVAFELLLTSALRPSGSKGHLVGAFHCGRLMRNDNVKTGYILGGRVERPTTRMLSLPTNGLTPMALMRCLGELPFAHGFALRRRVGRPDRFRQQLWRLAWPTTFANICR